MYLFNSSKIFSKSVRSPLDFADVDAFGGAMITDVSAPADAARIETAAGRRGSLVFSELFHAIPIEGGQFYRTGQYIELYNNSDSTVYLGGKILGRAMWYNSELSTAPGICSSLADWRADSRGIWSGRYVRIPGTDREHALNPGRAAVIAMDAIDHSAFAPGMPDLTGAAFEYVGEVDVDNPAVPNVEDVGPSDWTNVIGQGLYISPSKDILFISERVDQDALAAESLPTPTDPLHHLFPASGILDVVALYSADPAPTNVRCSPFAHPSFDRQPATLLDESLVSSIQRRVLGSTGSGRLILQRTKTSAADLYRTAPSPGVVR